MKKAIKGKVLIVEDEQLCANLLQTFLEQLGYKTASLAGAGDEAIKITAEERPDIALMDVNLQGEMSGPDTAREIFSRFGVRSIFVSGYPKEEIADSTEGEWSLGYVSKPYNLDQLEATIASAIEKSRKAEASKTGSR